MTRYADITFDTTEIDGLADLLATARERPHKERADDLTQTADSIATKSRAIVATYQKDSTGLLGESIQVEGTPVHKRIFADVREAFFLETGSPNTGGPRDWLTGPAQEGIDEMFERLSRAGQIW